MKHLAVIDLVIMIVYVVGIVWYGLRKGKGGSSEDYFLSGRDVLWPMVGISLVAANISSNTLIGLASEAYTRGVGVFNYEWMAAAVLVFFCIFLMPFYLRSQIYTVPEFLERRYDARSRYYFSFITIVLNIVVDLSSALYASGIVLDLMFPNLFGGNSLFWWSGILAAAAAAYTVPGGLSSVVHTETIQGVLLFVCAIILSVIVYDAAGGWQHVLEVMAQKRANVPDMLHLVQARTSKNIPWTGLAFGVPILGFYFWANNQLMVQRILGAKDINNGRWGALFAGLLKLPVIFIMVLPGIMALALPDSVFDHKLCEATPNNVYPQLVLNLLPTGLKGLVLAGMLAALSGHISATMNSASTLFTMDFVAKFRPDLSGAQLVRVGKIAALVVCVLSWLWVPVVVNFKSLFEYLQLVLGLICPPVVGIFLLGLFWKRATKDGAFWGLMAGLVFMFYFISCHNTDGYMVLGQQFHFLEIAPILMVMTMIVTIIISFVTPAPDAEAVKPYIWTTTVFNAETKDLEGTPWYQNYRYLSIILLILTAIVVGMFW